MSFTFREKTLFEKLEKEGFNIIKLHERLEEAQIEHIFVDRRAEQIEMSKVKNEDKVLELVNDMIPFDYQIYIEENGNKISLIQSFFSYGITKNLIEVYNFQHEPVVLDHEMAAVLIRKNKLNSYIIAVNEKNVEELEKLQEILQSLKEDKQ
jgi:hypothetical protein